MREARQFGNSMSQQGITANWLSYGIVACALIGCNGSGSHESPPATTRSTSSHDHATAVKPAATDLVAAIDAASTTPADSPSSEPERFDAARLVDHPAGIEQRLRLTVNYLASDQLEGRGVGTAGIERAAEFIAAEFRRAGLRTDHYAGTPFQQFARSSRLRVTDENRMAFRADDGRELTLVLRQDFTPLSITGISDLGMPLAFVGYGITAPEFAYDDYAGLDVDGKVVVILRNEPRRFDTSSPFRGAEDSEHARLTRKVANAAAHGAVGVLFCTDRATLARQASSGGSGQPADQSPLASYDSLMAFNVPGRSSQQRMPIVHVHRRVIESLVRESTEEDLSDWETAIDQRLAPASRSIDRWSVEGRIELGRQTSSLKNVVATLDASGPLAQETIVVGAHYDHLGYGGGWGSLAPWTRAVHNGADDNASGTTVLLEIARQLAARDQPLRRRVMFIAFTAEESGLIGSEYYVDHPLVPLDQTVAMLNLDMVGYLRASRLEVYGTGTAAEFNSLADSFGTKHGMRILKEPDGYGPSDHASFYGRGIPVLHFFTGFHDTYHRPSDDPEKLNLAGMRRIAQMVTEMVVELANRDTRPTRTESSFDSLLADWDETPRPQSVATAVRTTPAQNVGLGLDGKPLPSNSGLILTNVVKDGFADRAGLRVGDCLLRANGKAIANTSDVQAIVESATETVAVIFRRGSIELETQMAVRP